MNNNEKKKPKNNLPSLKKESKGELDIFVLQLRYHDFFCVTLIEFHESGFFTKIRLHQRNLICYIFPD